MVLTVSRNKQLQEESNILLGNTGEKSFASLFPVLPKVAPAAHTLAAPADWRRKAALRPSSHFEGGFPEETRPPSLFGKAVSADGTLGDTEDRPEAVRHGYEPGNRYGKNPAHFHRHSPGKCDVLWEVGWDWFLVLSLHGLAHSLNNASATFLLANSFENA